MLLEGILKVSELVVFYQANAIAVDIAGFRHNIL